MSMFNNLAAHQNAFHAACIASWKRKRGPYVRLDSAYDHCLESADDLLSLKVDGRSAHRRVRSIDEVSAAIESMIEEMWPLELI